MGEACCLASQEHGTWHLSPGFALSPGGCFPQNLICGALLTSDLQPNMTMGRESPHKLYLPEDPETSALELPQLHRLQKSLTFRCELVRWQSGVPEPHWVLESGTGDAESLQDRSAPCQSSMQAQDYLSDCSYHRLNCVLRCHFLECESSKLTA